MSDAGSMIEQARVEQGFDTRVEQAFSPRVEHDRSAWVEQAFSPALKALFSMAASASEGEVLLNASGAKARIFGLALNAALKRCSTLNLNLNRPVGKSA